MRASDSRGAFTMLEAVAEPGAVTPLHLHSEVETIRILEGVLTFCAGEEIVALTAGSTVTIPAGTPHAWRNGSDAPVRMLAVFAPGGIEAMFAGVEGLSPEAIARHAAAFGTVVVGAPPLF